MVVSKDLSEALVADYQVLGKPNPAYRRLLLAGLDLEANYQINQLPQLRSGKDLSSIGLIMGGNYVGRAKTIGPVNCRGLCVSTVSFTTSR